ncbi:monocarboxylate transporter 5 isoform X1 [Euwallacea fornicatus]|uniref:monocarboxylate transporter 5 isoform X1 n=1 Tax=Euwallacea fornicatus TaxID=995702 RepID=UPI00338EAD60
MFMENKKLVPPDGGWGWIVVIGVSAVNLCTRSIEQSFGLLFGDLLSNLGVETTGAAVIMSTLDALINFSGLFVGPLIRTFSYRKVSLAGSILVASGLIMTSWASSMAHIIVTYSIINGLGVGLTASATFVALNNYFLKRRGQAIGYSLAGTAFGMMLMPQAVTLLLDEFGFRGAIFLLGGFALNSLVGSILLQPAKWHFVPDEKCIEDGEYKQRIHFFFASSEEMETIKEDGEEEEAEQEEVNKLISNHLVVKTFEELKAGGLTRKSTFPRNFSTMSFAGNKAGRRRTSKESIMDSYSRLDFTGSSIQLAIDPPDSPEISSGDNHPSRLRRNLSYPGVQFSSQNKVIKELQKEPLKVQEEQKKTSWQRLVKFMDFDLLQDPTYLNLVFGLSVFYVAEQNFKMVMPFFFKSIGYDKTDVALFLSVQAFTDILARLILPPICDRLDVSKRTLFMSGIFFLGLCRSILAHQTDYVWILVWLVIAGFVRGAALINFAITISEYATLEKLPAAFGLHNVGKGLFVVTMGPILGKIRDATASYPICLHSQTCLIMTCVLAWSIEYCILYCRNRTAESEKSDTDTTNT